VELRIEYIDPDKLTPYENNAKQHPDEQVEHIANSIREFGFRQPIVVDADNVVVIGHGRLLAAKKLGLETVPVVRADDLTEAQVKALRLADNKTNESGWDFTALEAELDELSAEIDMADFGFDSVSEDGFGEAFTLESGDKQPFTQMTFTLANEQAELIKTALQTVKGEIVETFGNENGNGNALYEVVREWAAQRR
jgi:site-specific DNA-methyltransferase (adenine-specific)